MFDSPIIDSPSNSGMISALKFQMDYSLKGSNEFFEKSPSKTSKKYYYILLKFIMKFILKKF